MAMRIGCDNLVYAILTEDNGETEPTYGEVKKAPGVMSININPNSSSATAFFDDGPGDSASTLGNIEVEIQKNFLSPQQKADFLGHALDSKGGLVYGGNDTPPWIAIGYRTLKSNGTYRYVWMHKGKFLEPEDNSETKGDTVNFQADTIVGHFVKVEKSFNVGGKDTQPWKYEVDAENTDIDPTIIDEWFTKVMFPTEDETQLP